MNRFILAAFLALSAITAFAQVTVQGAWVRATAPQQQAGGAYMQLRSSVDATLVSASSPVAGAVQIHEMSMDGNIMKMRQLTGLDLPAGKLVELKPGAYHLMLLDLKQQLVAGTQVPLSLVFTDKSGKQQVITIQAPVQTAEAQGAAEAVHH